MKQSSELTKAARFEARITEDQKELFMKAAALGGHRTLTEFVINSAQESANAIISANEVLRLSEKDRHIFVEALLHPPAPNKKLKLAAKRYKNLSRGK